MGAAGVAAIAFATAGPPARAVSPSGLTGPQFAPATLLLSRSEHGGLPNGPSCCGVVSHDQRIGAVMAFESTASDITHGARLGTPNVYAVLRRGPWSVHGSMWVPGRRILVSRGLHGRPANGPSYAPAVSGDSAHPPRCVAFISRASNLVPGDGNRVADAFVLDLASRRIQRVSVDTAGAEADQATTEVAVSGDCRRVAFTSAASNLAETRPVAGARTGRPRPGTRQVYVRFLAGSGRMSGLTMLASALGARPANADAAGLSLSRDGTALAFVSAASDLGAPSRGVAQVWERAITLGGSLSGRTRLVSQAPGRLGGNGPSSRPSIDHDGRLIAFATTATDLLPGANGVTQIVRADTTGPAPKLNWISQSSPQVAVGAGVSSDPKITDGGEWVFFDSAAENLEGPRAWTPGEREVFRWTSPDLVSSKDTRFVADRSLGGPINLPARTGAWNPDTSARGNYLVFESEDQGLDPRLPHGAEPPWYIPAPSG
ncbi:MAG TPA: hypothetical protein VFR49_02975, partial [Solirubrobacteraceae bacterium]|nr:hypothetical protein [Solirubrobacteraceae bacterium]